MSLRFNKLVRLIVLLHCTVLVAPCSYANDCENDFGQMLMVNIPPSPSKKVGGITLFRHNLEQATSMNDVLLLTRELQKGRSTPLFIAVDQEGGLVQRLNTDRGFTEIPSFAAVGLTNNPRAAFEFGRITGKELAAVGVNVNFGTVVDVNSNSQNPVIGKLDRSYSNDAKKVAAFALANIKSYFVNANDGMPRVMPTLKHFPGHGDTETDSHLGLAIVNKTLDQLDIEELVPYKKIFATLPAAQHPAVMMGHLSLPKILSDSTPATLSKEIVTGILRQRMGFKGLIFTDDLSMGAIEKFEPNRLKVVTQAIKAGNDVILFASRKSIFSSTQEQDELITQVCAIAKTDPELASRVRESAKRILDKKVANGLFNVSDIPDGPPNRVTVQHQAVLRRLGLIPRQNSPKGTLTSPKPDPAVQ